MSAMSTSLLVQSVDSSSLQTVHCPNCGAYAQRWFHAQTIRTECVHCDYVLTLSANAQIVIEAYHPGIASLHATI